jgi:hypothetical protein
MIVCVFEHVQWRSVLNDTLVRAYPRANDSDASRVAGADKPSGECVLYPNGEVDPWHGLGVLTSPSKGIDVMMVGGASHHAWYVIDVMVVGGASHCHCAPASNARGYGAP